MTTIDRKKLIGLYARLKGMERTLAIHSTQSIDGYYADDIAQIVREVGTVLNENIEPFIPHHSAVWRGASGNSFTSSEKLSGRLQQLIGYLEATQHVGTEIVEIGTLYNAIKDEELRGRCADLLSASVIPPLLRGLWK